MDEAVNPGTAKVIWNGRDDHGASVASGVYFARVVTEHNSTVVEMALVK